VLEKAVDIASVPLTARAVSGQHVAHARIALVSSGEQPYAFLTFDLTDVTVASVRQVQHSDSLTEEVSLNFVRIAYTFVPQKADGSLGAPLTFCWDLAANRAC
jgi:type VI secretion system secreted protein Hcp